MATHHNREYITGTPEEGQAEPGRFPAIRNRGIECAGG